MSKGRSVDTTGKIDPALVPLLTGSSQNILQQQAANPVSDYNAPTIKGVAGLSDYQRFAGQQIGSLNQPNAGQQFGLAALMNAMNMGNKPAAGSAAPGDPRARSGGVDMSEISKALAPFTGASLPNTPNASAYYQAQSPQGPLPRNPDGSTPGTGPINPNGGDGGSGGGGGGHVPLALGKSSGLSGDSGFSGYDSMGRALNSNTAVGTTGFVGPNHTYSKWNGSSWETLMNPGSSDYASDGQKLGDTTKPDTKPDTVAPGRGRSTSTVAPR